MTIDDFDGAGYRLRSWKISSMRGVRTITLLLVDRHGRKFITACPCSDKKLVDENFTIPIKIDIPAARSYGS